MTFSIRQTNLPTCWVGTRFFYSILSTQKWQSRVPLTSCEVLLFVTRKLPKVAQKTQLNCEQKLPQKNQAQPNSWRCTTTVRFALISSIYTHRQQETGQSKRQADGKKEMKAEKSTTVKKSFRRNDKDWLNEVISIVVIQSIRGWLKLDE